MRNRHEEEVHVTGAYQHMDEGALEARYAEESAGHPNAPNFGVRRALALGGIAAVGLISYFGAPKVIDVLKNADQAASNAAAGRTVPENTAEQIEMAQQTINENERANAADAAREAAQNQP